MIPLAFYAPLKPPDHPTPSGDRTIARALLAALRYAGFEPEVASILQTRDGLGDAVVQHARLEEAKAEHAPLIRRGRRAGWRLWLTYHNYYKAPDLIGPAVAAMLDIPYAQIEATRARKRFGGPWDVFAHKAEDAADAAELIFYLTERDAIALRAYAPPGQSLVHLPPFLARTDLPHASRGGSNILSVGMMRAGDKLESYRLIAQTLRSVPGDWCLEIAGDGPARAQVEQLFAPFEGRVRFLGLLNAALLEQAYARAKVMLWPGVNEAFGMTYLEAQAAGVPVVAQARPGVSDVLPPDVLAPSVASGAQGLAQALAQVLERGADRHALRKRIAARHLLPAASKTLKSALDPLL